ncbi:hypothetical protein GCM10027046_28810 [Uliginosibacterium flavum]
MMAGGWSMQILRDWKDYWLIVADPRGVCRLKKQAYRRAARDKALRACPASRQAGCGSRRVGSEHSDNPPWASDEA